MTKKTFFLSLIILILSEGCNKVIDDDFRTSELQSPTITGFYIINEYGENIGVKGVPNVKNSIDNKKKMVIYPNPCRFRFNIRTSLDNQIKQCWIVRGYPNFGDEGNIIDNGMVTSKIGGLPLLQTEFFSNEVSCDVSSLGPGYYRVYLKTESHLLYDNIVIYE
jgi:hypothetical protein